MKRTAPSPGTTTASDSAADTLHAELTRLYWGVGERLHREVLGGERAQYGA